MKQDKAKQLVEDEFLNILLKECPYEIPEGIPEGEEAKEVLRGVVFGGSYFSRIGGGTDERAL